MAWNEYKQDKMVVYLTGYKLPTKDNSIIDSYFLVVLAIDAS